jgi:hypothetical protein
MTQRCVRLHDQTMDSDRFERLARDPKRTRDELEAMRKNALEKEHREFAALVDEILGQRFPAAVARTGGATPTTARMLKSTGRFPSGKEAYLWLVERFMSHRPSLLDEYVRWHSRANSGSSRFARDPIALFPPGSTRAANSSFYARLPEGWFADTNLSHSDKFTALMQLSHLCRLTYPEDWSFEVDGATVALMEQQRLVESAREILARLINAG